MANEDRRDHAGDDEDTSIRGWVWWRKVLLALLIIGVLVLIWHFFIRGEESPAQSGPGLPPPATVAIAQATQDTWDGDISATGTFAAVRGVDVAAELPGTITAILFDAGDFVTQGTPLVRLDTSSEQAQLGRLQAQLQQASAAADRGARLIDRGAISRAELEQAVANRDAIAAQLAEVRATIEKKVIRAPFSGRLGIRQVNKGQFLAAGTPIAQLVQPSPLYLNFELPESSIAAVSTGQSVEARVDGPTETIFGGRVTAINPDVAPGTRNFTVQATIANSDGTIRPGQFASVTLKTGEEKSVITVPATAISFNAYGSSVFVAEEPTPEQRKALQNQASGPGNSDGGGLLAWLFSFGDGPPESDQKTNQNSGNEGKSQEAKQGPQFIARRVFVKTGGRRDLGIEILEGLQPGQRVVVSGQIKLTDGTPLIPASRDALKGVPKTPSAP